MTNHDEHIASSYDHELGVLDTIIDRMAGLTESQLDHAVNALTRRDNDLASQVMADDKQVDKLKRDAEAQSLKVLALRSPVANDLRRVITTLKVAGEMERIADLAANCAKRTLVLSHQSNGLSHIHGLSNLGRIVQTRLKASIDAYRHLDVAAAQQVRDTDVDVDALYSALFREILTYMMEDPRTITAGSHLLFVAKNLERVGDHATNIAEETIFLVTGHAMEEDRPKGDTTTQTL